MGQRPAVLAPLTDVTEQRRNEEWTRPLRIVFETVADAVLISGPDGVIKWVNPAFTRMTGWEAHEAAGHTPRILKSGQHDASFYRGLWDTICAGKVWRGEVTNRRKDGALYTGDLTITPVIDDGGRITEFVAVQQDVTIRNGLAKALGDREIFYRSIIERTLDVIILIGRDRTFRYISPAIKSVLGYDPAAWTGHQMFELVHPDDVPAILAAWKAGHDPRSMASVECRLRHADGSWRAFEAVGKNLLDDPVVNAVIITTRDITERRKTEALQQQLRDRLAQSEKLAALSELLAGVAHELNNPLSVVIGFASLLVQSPDLKAASRAQRIDAAAQRCGRIVKNFLSLARHHEPERGAADVNSLVRQTVELLGYGLRVDSVDVTLDLDPRLPAIWADSHQLNQVLVNLITNAHHAVRETPLPRRVCIATVFDEPVARVSITVADSGRGIPPEVEARIFEPFFTTKSIGQGTGLGLPICKGIVEAHHGVLEVEGRPGAGALFRVWLPVGEPVERDETVAASLRAGRAERVLVVDDEADVAGVLKEMLEETGYRVDTAADGVDALNRLAVTSYDAVLSDVKMPRLDGLRFFQALETSAPQLRRRFAFITGDTLTPGTLQFIEATAAPCLKKPFTQENAKAVLTQLLSSRD